MIHTNLFDETDAHEIVETLENYSILEYKKDYALAMEDAAGAYFASMMNIHKRQVIIEINGRRGVYLQAGAMQLTMGAITIESRTKGVMDILKKYVTSKMTEETMFKPHYTGKGLILLEPTTKYLLLQDLDDWNGCMVIEDGMFLACDDTVEVQITPQSTVSAAMFGQEGLFNNTLTGSGIVVLESPVPQEELIIVDIEDDEVRIDGSMAIAWSKSLEFTVEMAATTPLGSFTSGEGFVNVYRGTGRLMIAPVGKNLKERKKTQALAVVDRKEKSPEIAAEEIERANNGRTNGKASGKREKR